MLIGYVSDEQFVAIPDALVQLERGGELIAARSTSAGAILADVPPGEYTVTLAKDGYGSKRVRMTAGAKPYQFRLLSNRLAAYVWPKWVKAGDHGDFRVHSVEPFRLTLWRYGLRREFVELLGWHDEHGPQAMRQITPDGDYTQTGAQWNRVGYSNPHINHLAVAPERSGLYFFHAETESGRFFAFPWVVAPRSPGASIAVLASTNTWNAYNNWGGRSNYVNAGGLPSEPVVNGRQDLPRYTKGPFSEWARPDEEFLPLSFDRPEPGNNAGRNEEAADPIAGRLQSSLAPGEWRLLAWLEREGFAYDFYSEYQLHSGELDLDAYQVLIFGVHPEYWSRSMYERVKRWVREKGGRILYLGGNGVNAEVEYLDSSTLRIRSHLLTDGGSFAMADPDHPGEVWESRFHRTVECEANLLGVVSSADAIMTAAPYKVLKAGHWAFEGTGLSDGDLFGERSLHERCGTGASGYEMDILSRYSPPETVLLAKGQNPGGGGEMACYELAGGGAAFAAGSITYISALLVDDAVSTITSNVIRRFLGGK
jgi:hypothetical protein